MSQNHHPILLTWQLKKVTALILTMSLSLLGCKDYDSPTQKVYDSSTQITIRAIYQDISHHVLDLYYGLGISFGGKLSELDVQALAQQLRANPRIESVDISIDSSGFIASYITGHEAIAYVEMRNTPADGKQKRYFVSEKGRLFSADGKYYQEFLNSPIWQSHTTKRDIKRYNYGKKDYQKFMNSPVWYLRKDDINEFSLGKKVSKESLKTIDSLFWALKRNKQYELPILQKITLLNEGALKLIFEGDSEVIIPSHDIKQQIGQLSKIYNDANSIKRRIRSIKLSSRDTPIVIFHPENNASKASPDGSQKKAKDSKAKNAPLKAS